MAEKKLITLGEYIVDKGITMQKFSYITGISYSRLAILKNEVNPSVSLETIVVIYEATKKEFGEGLACWEWLDLPKFWEK